MGLSRNKVAVSEGAAGSPPFYGDPARDQGPASRRHRDEEEEKSELRGKKLLFNFEGSKRSFKKEKRKPSHTGV